MPRGMPIENGPLLLWQTGGLWVNILQQYGATAYKWQQMTLSRAAFIKNWPPRMGQK